MCLVVLEVRLAIPIPRNLLCVYIQSEEGQIVAVQWDAIDGTVWQLRYSFDLNRYEKLI